MKLLLYSSYKLAPDHLDALMDLTGKAPQDITFAVISNAVDVYEQSDWVQESVAALTVRGSQVQPVDLRKWKGNPHGLRDILAASDVIWVCGGHTYYLRWLMRETGADDVITELVRAGKVYAGWSAGACIAGPTLKYLEPFDDPKDAPEMIYEGLGLTDAVILPHVDMDDFAEGMERANQKLQREGYHTVPLREDQALLVDGDTQTLI